MSIRAEPLNLQTILWIRQYNCQYNYCIKCRHDMIEYTLQICLWIFLKHIKIRWKGEGKLVSRGFSVGAWCWATPSLFLNFLFILFFTQSQVREELTDGMGGGGCERERSRGERCWWQRLSLQPCILLVRVIAARNLPIMDRSSDLTGEWISGEGEVECTTSRSWQFLKKKNKRRCVCGSELWWLWK